MAKVKISAELRLRNASVIEARKKLGLSQIRAAKFIEIPLRVLVDIEALRPGVDPLHVRRVADVLELDLDTVSAALPEGVDNVRRSLAELDVKMLEAYKQTMQARALEAPAAAETLVDKKATAGAVQKVLNTLAFREREIVKLRYGIGDAKGYAHTIEEVGRKFKITRNRVHQIEAKALRKLQHPKRVEILDGLSDGSKDKYNLQWDTDIKDDAVDRLVYCMGMKYISKAHTTPVTTFHLDTREGRRFLGQDSPILLKEAEDGGLITADHVSATVSSYTLTPKGSRRAAVLIREQPDWYDECHTANSVKNLSWMRKAVEHVAKSGELIPARHFI